MKHNTITFSKNKMSILSFEDPILCVWACQYTKPCTWLMQYFWGAYCLFVKYRNLTDSYTVLKESREEVWTTWSLEVNQYTCKAPLPAMWTGVSLEASLYFILFRNKIKIITPINVDNPLNKVQNTEPAIPSSSSGVWGLSSYRKFCFDLKTR